MRSQYVGKPIFFKTDLKMREIIERESQKNNEAMSDWVRDAIQARIKQEKLS